MERARPVTSLVPAPRRLDWPSVGVVLVTGDRPQLLRRALDAVVAQDYPGSMRLVVVYDGVAPDWGVASGGERPVLVLENWRTAGAAGARNTGVLAVGDCDLVAFCDDRDTWSPTKLTAQVAVMGSRPGTLLCTCAAEVEYDGHRTPQLIGHGRLGPAALTRARAAALRPSGVVASQRALATPERRGGIGLVDESAPARAEDWDLLVRAARHAPILHLDTALVRLLWWAPSTDTGACLAEIAALRWMLDRHPELHQPRVFSDLACWYAAAGDRRGTWHWVLASLRHWAVDRRGLRAVAVSAGLLSRRSLAIRLREHRRP